MLTGDGQEPSNDEQSDPNSAFYRDVAHMLKRYVAGVEDLLDDASTASALAEQHTTLLDSSTANPSQKGRFAIAKPSASQAAVELRQREEALRAARACDRYRALLTAEHDRWVRGREELAEIQIEARRQDLEVVRQNFADPAPAMFQAAVRQRVAEHLGAMRPAQRRTSKNGTGDDPLASAKREWSDEMCRTAVKDLRQEWRIAQKRLLNSLAREMRQERQVAVDALEKQAQAWRQLAAGASAAWDAELQKAQEQLDRLADGFAKALQVLLEAEHLEARKHLTDQSDYFKSELQDALRLERSEQARVGLQIRKMRIALLKWQRDYTTDAQRKAERVAQQQRFQALGMCNPWDELQDGQEDDGQDQLDEDAVNEALRMAESALSRMREEDQAQAAPGMLKGTVRRLTGEAAGQRLARAREVTNHIHKELPVDSAAVREFLLRAEQSAPACGEVLRVYEEHLAEHGIIVPLVAPGKPASAEGEGQGAVAPASGEAPMSPMSPMSSALSTRSQGSRTLGVRTRSAMAAHKAYGAPRSARRFR
mmetsp:Transcript_106323/g.297628  ORF Transcript_106323/g.297628 Transcript_106323/m.297628 type:complete len:539 (-) Transcript_106323:83-1699(-)